MPIYDRPVKTLMEEFARSELKPEQVFSKSQAVSWFRSHYPKIKSNTVQMHVEAMSVNSTLRQHHPSIKPGSGHDLFYKLGSREFRLWNRETDPGPRYGNDLAANVEMPEDDDEPADDVGGDRTSQFAFERDLQNFLEKNLTKLEPGLRVYEDEGLTGIEFPAGSRRIDILAIGEDGAFVVIELKVSRGYDRVIGQIMRYMAWVKANVADGRAVRGIIVASDISDDLRLAASLLPDVKLVEYEIEFRLKPLS